MAKLGSRAWTKASRASDARRSAVSTNRMACWSKKLDIICRGQGVKKKKRQIKKNAQINSPLYSVYLSLPIQATAFTKQRRNEYSGHCLHSHARTLKIYMPFLLLWGICTAHSSLSADCYWNATILVCNQQGLVFLQHSGLYFYLSKIRMKVIIRTNTLRSPSSLSCYLNPNRSWHYVQTSLSLYATNEFLGTWAVKKQDYAISKQELFFKFL